MGEMPEAVGLGVLVQPARFVRRPRESGDPGAVMVPARRNGRTTAVCAALSVSNF